MESNIFQFSPPFPSPKGVFSGVEAGIQLSFNSLLYSEALKSKSSEENLSTRWTRRTP